MPIQKPHPNPTNGQLISLGDTNVLSTAGGTFSVNRNQNYNSAVTVNAGSSGVKRISGGPGLTAQQTPSITGAIQLNADVTLGNGTSGIYTGIGNAGVGGLALTGVITGDAARKITVEGTNPFVDVPTYITNIANATLAVGMVKIAGANSATFFGNVDVPRGVLALTGDTNSLANSTISIGPNGGLDFQNSSVIGGLSDLSGSGGTVTTSNTSARNLTIKGAGPYSFSGIVANPAAGKPTLLNLIVGNGSNATLQTLSGSNSYTGATTIGNQGTLIMGNANALGTNGLGRTTATGGTTASNGGSLDLNGQSGVNEVITLNGSGVGGLGALTNGSATAASIASGVVSSLSITSASGLDATSTVVFSGGGGSGATAVATLGLSSASFAITSGTQTYSTAPTVAITGGGGTGATATAVLTDGLVTGVTITNVGYDYTTVPTIAFSGGTALVVGTVPGGTGNATNFTLAAVRLTANGSGYTSAPAVSLSTGTAAITANLSSVVLASDATVGGTGNITIHPPVSGGTSGLSKVGADTVTLAAANTYTGNTTIETGTLSLASPSLADTSTVSIAAGAFLNITHGATDDVAGLKIGDDDMPAGIYPATPSGPITGSGSIRVVAPSGYGTWASTNAGGQPPSEDYDDDGTSNGVEYFMNAPAGFTGNPNVEGEVLKTVTWTNGGNIPDTDYGTQFVVQTSTDLVDWVPVPFDNANLSNSTGSVIYTITGSGKQFVRLKVTPD